MTCYRHPTAAKHYDKRPRLDSKPLVRTMCGYWTRSRNTVGHTAPPAEVDCAECLRAAVFIIRDAVARAAK